MKSGFGTAALAVAMLIVGFMLSSARTNSTFYASPELHPAPMQPQTESKVMTLLPGQLGRMHNREYRKIEIHSQYPIHVMSGNCESTYTVDYSCDGDPDDVVIQDLRRPPLFATPHSNVVAFKFTAY